MVGAIPDNRQPVLQPKETPVEAPAEATPAQDSEGITIADAVANFMNYIRDHKKPATTQGYKVALRQFVQSCAKTLLHDVNRNDLLSYLTFLRQHKDVKSTVKQKFSVVRVFLKANDTAIKFRKEDWPKPPEEDVEIYEKEDLEKFFAACNKDELVLFKFFLMTGFRDMEVAHVYWIDVNWAAHTIRVHHKPELNWTPKTYRERTVPVPAELIALLREHKARANGSNLIFPNKSGTVYNHILTACKDIAKRAGLDPEHFWLHKFRATFATWHLWEGVDVRTAQAWMGHSKNDLKSIMRYLKPKQDESTKEKVNATFA